MAYLWTWSFFILFNLFFSSLNSHSYKISPLSWANINQKSSPIPLIKLSQLASYRTLATYHGQIFYDLSGTGTA